MKKIIKCLPILTLSTLPLIAVKCVKKELTKEELEKILKLKYEKEYIDKKKYIFDDFEQFEIKDEYFEEASKYKRDWQTSQDRKIFQFSLQFIKDFNKWYDNFQWKFGIFKDIMNKYAANEVIRYDNPYNPNNSAKLYYVKEVKFDFSRGLKPQEYSIWNNASLWDNTSPEFITKLFNLPNLNLNISIWSSWNYLDSTYLEKTYYSKLNIVSRFNDKESFKKIIGIPKPKYKNEYFVSYPMGKYDYNDDVKPTLNFEGFKSANYFAYENSLLYLRYLNKSQHQKDIDFLKEYGNYDPFHFKSYRIEIYEYYWQNSFDSPPSKEDIFLLEKPL